MKFIPSYRQALKDLADFSIDAQFCQQYGTQVFNHSEEITPKYQQLCDCFSAVVDDLISTLQQIQKEIPEAGRVVLS